MPAAQDLSLGASQLRLLGGGLLRLLSPTPDLAAVTSLGELRMVVEQAVAGGCCSVASVAPHQQLAWLLEADAAQPEALPAAGRGARSRKWRTLLRQSLAHQAWFAFHSALWAGAGGALPPAHAGQTRECLRPVLEGCGWCWEAGKVREERAAVS